VSDVESVHVVENGRLVLPDRVVEGAALVLRGGIIEAIVPQGSRVAGAARLDVGGRLVTPGLIDIHIHGACGRSFNEADPAAYAVILRAALEHGVTSVLATLATAPIADLVACLGMVRDWIAADRTGMPPGATLLGAHVEGPYFSRAQVGAQNPAHLRRPDDGSAGELLAYDDVVRMMSFAPELPGAAELTAELLRRRIVPAAGHSSAREEDVQACWAAGLRHTIHIWSGQSSTVREGPWRKPGLLEVTLTYDDVTGEMIADHRHLPATLMRLAYKSLGPDRLCLISDATSGAGLPEGSRFGMGGMEYVVEDGVGMMLDGSAFAGSTTLLDGMVRVMTEVVGASIPEAVRMATLTPARVIGLAGRKGRLAAGMDADLVIWAEDMRPWRVVIGGREVYPT
jgi:N-acetylglucosamine-6-phosphate deacetylase